MPSRRSGIGRVAISKVRDALREVREWLADLPEVRAWWEALPEVWVWSGGHLGG